MIRPELVRTSPTGSTVDTRVDLPAKIQEILYRPTRAQIARAYLSTGSLPPLRTLMKDTHSTRTPWDTAKGIRIADTLAPQDTYPPQVRTLLTFAAVASCLASASFAFGIILGAGVVL